MRYIKMVLEVAESNYKKIQEEKDYVKRLGQLEGLVEFTLTQLKKEVEANV